MIAVIGGFFFFSTRAADLFRREVTPSPTDRTRNARITGNPSSSHSDPDPRSSPFISTTVARLHDQRSRRGDRGALRLAVAYEYYRTARRSRIAFGGKR